MGERVVRNDEAAGSIPARSTIIMHRTYIKDADLSKKNIRITDSNEVHHIAHVMRLGVGGSINVFNAAGDMASVVISGIEDNIIIGEIKSVERMVVNGARIVLACAIPKRVKFEEIIEKATELGVDEIIPLKTARSEVFIKDDKAAVKESRFMKVAVAAAKQSGRGQVPVIKPMMPLKEALSVFSSDAVKLFPSLHGHPTHIREEIARVSRQGKVVIFIGPEGDFTPQEVDMAVKAGCVPVSLGQTVLRVDTAAISSVALARYLLRD